MKKILFLSIPLFFLLSNFALAQEIPTAQTELVAQPQIPEPGDVVQLRFATYGTSVDLSTIIWRRDGVVFDEKTNRSSFVVGPDGGDYFIQVTARDTSGKELFAEIRIQTSIISLFVEGFGRTPPFYKGGVTPIKEGSFWVHAIPEITLSSGQKANPRNLVFNWYKNNQKDVSQSGLGKDSLFIEGNILSNKQKVRLVIEEVGSSRVVGSKTVEISFENPSVSIYEENPLYGILFNKAFKNQEELLTPEIQLIAIPYSFSKLDSLSYLWRKDGQRIFSQDTNTNSVAFRKTEEGGGRNSISVNVSNENSFSQEASNSFIISFE